MTSPARARSVRPGRPSRLIFALLAAAALLGCAAEAACGNRGEPAGSPPPGPDKDPAVVLTNARGESWTVLVEVARTPEQQRVGLMYRKSLPPDRGMVFIYPDARPRAFWMKNTYVALDMIFIGADRRVAGIVENAEPLTETSRSVDAPSRWVLEVGAGEAAAHGIGPGDRVYFYNFEP